MDDRLVPLSTCGPEAEAAAREMSDLHSRKLYHQLTERLLAIVSTPPAGVTAGVLASTFADFVLPIAPRLSQLRAAVMARDIAEAMGAQGGGIDFLDRVLPPKEEPKEEKAGDDAMDVDAGAKSTGAKAPIDDPAGLLVLRAERGRLLANMGDTAGAKEAMNAVMAEVSGWPGCEGVVLAGAHRLAAEYYEKIDEPGEYYTHALRYLAHVELSTIDRDDRLDTLARSLAVSALRGSDVFNFGQLLIHPIVSRLEVAHPWIHAVLSAFDAGDRSAFARLVASPPAGDAVSRAICEPESVEKLGLKLAVMTLVKMLHEAHPATLAAVALKDVGEAVGMAPEGVEKIIMLAMRVGLVRGRIDQAAGTLSVEWVKPRVLTRAQVTALAARVGEWEERVQEVGKDVAEGGSELFRVNNAAAIASGSN